MKFKESIVFAIAWLWLSVNGVEAQAPASVSGKTLIMAITSGTAPFASSGAELLLPSNSGTAYSLVNVTNLSVSTGTYAYAASNADGLLTVNDSKAGTFSGDFTFDDNSSGTFSFSQTSSGADQNGTFSIYSGKAPASLSGKTLALAIQGGTTNSGTATAAFTATSVTLTTAGSSFNVPYTYTILNTSVGRITASELGVTVTAYFAFSDPANGGFAVQDSSGYEYGTLNIPDHTPPTEQIRAPTAGLLVSNANYTAIGTAADNVAVSNVWYSFNNSAWTGANGGNSWSNWTAAVTLQPGTNKIAAYAIDTSGNVSTTNTIRFVYVVTAPLLVSTNGRGTLSPNDHGVLLQIGRNYSITAKPASGFIFTNWTGGSIPPLGWLTNGATVQFTMISNLMLQANFVDVTRPTLTITTPVSGQHLTNALATVRGTASDNWKVASVWYQLNGGVWNAPATANGWTNWATTVPLQAATNTFRAYALDLGGNHSLTNSVSFVSSNAFKLQLGFTSGQPVTAQSLNFDLQLSTGLNGHIQVSTNLVDWVTLTNFTGTNSPIEFHDPAATNPIPRFYRAVIP